MAYPLALLTVQEFQNAPTALDLTTLVPGGDANAQTAELTNVIARASQWIYNYCQQILVATTDTETQTARITRDGRLYVRTRNNPILQLLSANWRVYATDAWNPIDLNQVILSSRADAFYVDGYWGWYLALGSRLPQVQYTYVNGYPNPLLAANATAGATTISVTTAVGISTNTLLTIYDGEFTEQITVAAVSGSVLTLTAGLLNNHNAGVAVSAVPADVKQAAILVATHFIKQRGFGTMSLNTAQAETMRETDRLSLSQELQQAKQILQSYKQVF